MQVLYNCKNRELANSLTWDEMCAYYYLMTVENGGGK